MEEVRDLDSLCHVWTVAYVAYTNTAACFAYPKYAFYRDSTFKVDPSVFPDVGSICVGIATPYQGFGQMSPCDMVEKEYGRFVALRINSNGLMLNERYSPSSIRPSYYFGSFNSSFATEKSDIEFQKLSSCPATRHLMQLIEVEGSLDLRKPLPGPVAMKDSTKIFTKNVIVEHVEGSEIMYYGPFETELTSDGRVRLSATEACGLYISKLSSDKVPAPLVIEPSQGFEGLRLVDSRPFTNNRTKSVRHDWVSDDILIDKIAQGLKAAKQLKGSSSEGFKKALKSCKFEWIYEQRRDRIEKLIAAPDCWERFGDALLDAMTQPEMAAHVVKLVADDRYLPYFSKKLVDTEAIRRETEKTRRELSHDLGATEARLAQLREEIEKNELRNSELEAVYQQTRDKAEEESRRTLVSLQEQIDSKTQELARITEELEGAEGHQQQVAARMGDLLADRDSLAADLLKDSVVRSAIELASQERIEGCDDVSPLINLEIATDSSEYELSDTALVEKVAEVLGERAARDLSFMETLNLLTCTVQSPLTILSGLPGTGKTSLARALGGSLGLVGSGRRFVEIGVERGWTSQRDWTGYFNPVMGRYEKTDPMAFDAVFALDREARQDVSATPFMFLLDEMNLSPAEYYWGPFLRAYDTYGSEGAWLDLGGPRRLNIPPHVRFIATANFDHTTDALSPRLLDRAWVIRLDPFEVDLDDDAAPVAPDFSGVRAFSWERLRKAFGVDPKARMTPMAREKFKRLLGIFASNGMPVSVRSQNLVRGYVTTLQRFSEEGDPRAALEALDLAVAQKVLPQVSMPSSPEAARFLDALLDECALLPVSAAALRRIKETGERDGFCTFFA